ncbi:MAG: hypothetical protein KIT18_09445 [Burkholderiales bacterium]|nr:hypothetical protein [Burkholderiales bacterium]
MRAPLVTHIQVQRKSLLKVALYSTESFGLCLLGLWLFYNNISLFGKVLVSGAFASFVFVVGALMVLFMSYSTLKNAEGDALEKDQGI